MEGQGYVPIGEYGQARAKYLHDQKRGQYVTLTVKGQIQAHLREIDKQANDLYDRLMPQLAEQAGATEELKNQAPLRWAGLMNNCKAQAEELIYSEIIYT